MAESRCPMCGESVSWDSVERLCAWCRMAIPSDAPYYMLYHPRRVTTLCSQPCASAFVALEHARAIPASTGVEE